jgi:hypothetical protein
MYGVIRLVIWNPFENKKGAKPGRNVLGLGTIPRPIILFLGAHLNCYTVTVNDKNHVFPFLVFSRFKDNHVLAVSSVW